MDQYELLSRAGHFWIRDRDLMDRTDQLEVLMKTMLVIRCEYHFYNRSFEYTAYSRLFDKVAEGDRIPEYEITFTDDSDGVTAIRAVRKQGE